MTTERQRGVTVEDVTGLLGALVHFVIVVGGVLFIAAAVLYGGVNWLADLLGIS